MGDEFQASKPIYMQIAERIQHQIIRKELLPGEKLSSVRDMAIQSSVNPNTIQRTYSELERMGIVESKRGQGTFVTEDVDVLKKLNLEMQREVLQNFVQNMNELGCINDEIIIKLKQFLNDREV